MFRFADIKRDYFIVQSVREKRKRERVMREIGEFERKKVAGLRASSLDPSIAAIQLFTL